jgi:hypothetical protein
VRRSPLAGFLVAIGLRSVLGVVERGAPTEAPAASPPAAPAAPPARGSVPPALPLGLFVLGVVMMVPFESALTRAVGVLALFGFVISGVFAIADPRRLGEAPELGHAHAAEVAHPRANG